MPILNLTINNYDDSVIPHKTDVQVPESWAELSQEKLFNLLPLIGKEQNDDTEIEAIQILIGYYARYIDEEDLFDLSEHAQWIWETPFHQRVFNSFEHSYEHLFTTEWSIVFDEERSQQWVLPDDTLYNCTMLETKVGFAYLAHYLNGNGNEHLDNAIACFCRPPKFPYDPNDPSENHDQREPFNLRLAKERAKQILFDVPLEMKMSILFFLMGSLEQISSKKEYKPIFKKGKPKEEKDQKKKKINAFSWREFARACTKIETLGTTIGDLDKAYFHDVLWEASKAAIEYEEKRIEFEMRKAQYEK